MTTWRLDTPTQTLILAADGDLARVVHWGPPLPTTEDSDALARAAATDLGGGTLDKVAPLSICPEAARSFPGQPGLEIARDGAPLYPRFALTDAEASETEITLTFHDAANSLTYTASFEVEGDLVATRAHLSGEAPLTVHRLSAPVLPAPQDCPAIIDWHGSWTREFHRQTTPWSHGARLRDARTGRSGHEHPPFALIPSRGATRTSGTCRALHLAWSGGHRFLAEELPDGRRQIQMGATPEAHTGTAFDTPDLLLAVSTTGEAGIARIFQSHIRDTVIPWPDRTRPRPVHYNCWEAVYFDHDLPTLRDIATRAARIGAERFVLDDGWFGKRDDDTTSLGDWTVDRRKWPDGLGPLIDHVQSRNMTFGLWVEPEMVNEDSDLFRAHPDWRLGLPDQTPGRGQYLLDLSRTDVQDHLFGALDALLHEYDIDYLKWDHNRTYPVPHAPQTEGLYALLDRLLTAHPGVEIESCASGGGRIDAGILARTHRVWLSDSNDAIERLRMQHEAALFLPPAITGSHVGPRTCHTTGRELPMAFRAWVAAQRHMGFEMDPRELTEAEAATLTAATTWWKATRDWRIGGTTIPLDSDDPAITPEIQIAPDGAQFVLFHGRAATSAQSLPRAQRLAGLDPEARYRLTLVNPEGRPPQSRGNPALLDGPVILTGASLMETGITLPWSWPATMWVVEGERL